ncbi:MAG: hypothetical protein J2P23_05950 [Microlunatus sp.]|nr:hypothetical protein [Microlunatus sp.]
MRDPDRLHVHRAAGALHGSLPPPLVAGHLEGINSEFGARIAELEAELANRDVQDTDDSRRIAHINDLQLVITRRNTRIKELEAELGKSQDEARKAGAIEALEDFAKILDIFASTLLGLDSGEQHAYTDAYRYSARNARHRAAELKEA